MRIVAIIQTRVGSSRFPAKVLKKVFNEPMFLKCVTRLSRSSKINEIVVATTTNAKDDIIENICKEKRVACFRGSEKDVLDRYYKAALAFEADAVVRVTSDCPLIDPMLVDMGILEFASCENLDYLTNTFPKRTFPRGQDYEIMTLDCLEFAHRNDSNISRREHVTPFIRANISKFKAINIINEIDYSKIRLTVDEPPDLQLINTIFNYFGHDLFSWYEVISLFEEHPHLYGINQHIRQKCLEFEDCLASDGIVEKKVDYHKYTKRMVLGTAQLGMNYGITNKSGKPDYRTALEIVKKAWVSGVRSFDTAQAYGESEQVLGACLHDLDTASEAKMITKLDPKIDHLNKAVIRKSIENSLNLLGVDKIHGLLIHKESSIDELTSGLYENLIYLKQEKLVSHIGVSCYEPSKAYEALKYDEIDMVQVPANALDDRFKEFIQYSSTLDKHVSVYLRSIFLQGILLCSPSNLPTNLNTYYPLLEEYHDLLRKYNIDTLTVGLNYVLLKYPQTFIIFGVERPEQITQIMDRTGVMLPDTFFNEIELLQRKTPIDLIKPFLWVK